MDFQQDIDSLSGNPEVDAILREMCDLTGMGFSAVARVTEERWIACHLLDRIEFGLKPGDELRIKTTICDEIRESREAVFIDCVSNAPAWRTHPTPILYGFQSYVSVPLIRADGGFFGTLCAIDPTPHIVDTADIRAAIDALAARVVTILDREG
ncbi:GAF domain-containing protein [Sphingomonas naphthae]|uniref:GAF domain-containing protein n=1 Tax=Sphingomonas naphthae TaxID=1813468 RepID=A0ABY7TMK5_9SPHN|nr:GAF domain-containing protein [Sphingomonas naphthae]WCT74389.1 GAF domain-containing protein [Sphingomonas naphthae]